MNIQLVRLKAISETWPVAQSSVFLCVGKFIRADKTTPTR